MFGQAGFFKIILDPLLTPAFGDAGQIPHVFQTFLNCQIGVQVDFLRKVADLFLDRRIVFFTVRDPVHCYSAAGRGQNRSQYPHQGGFSRAVFPQQAINAAGDFQIRVAYGCRFVLECDR